MSDYRSEGDARRTLTGFSAGRPSTLTKGETVLQTVNTLLGYRGSAARAIKAEVGRGAEVDDTPVMESFAEGCQHA